MIEIYEKNNTNYDSNGDMTLFPLSCVVEAVLNGEWELELDHSIDEDGRWKYIMPDAVVCCPTFVSDSYFGYMKQLKTMTVLLPMPGPYFSTAEIHC